MTVDRDRECPFCGKGCFSVPWHVYYEHLRYSPTGRSLAQPLLVKCACGFSVEAANQGDIYPALAELVEHAHEDVKQHKLLIGLGAEIFVEQAQADMV